MHMHTHIQVRAYCARDQENGIRHTHTWPHKHALPAPGLQHQTHAHANSFTSTHKHAQGMFQRGIYGNGVKM